MSTVLITGSNRGLGLEFVRQYAADKWDVLACCRNPDDAVELRTLANAHRNIRVLRLEVTDHSRIDELARELAGRPIDVLLNNAGVYGPNKMLLGQIDYATWRNVLEVNTLAPLKMTEAFLDHVTRSEKKVIACVSSTMGSIAANAEGRHYLYRSSKAALNMVVKSLSVDLASRGITAVALCPGWVQTDMGGPNATLKPDESIRGMCKVLARLTPRHSGKFFSYSGAEVPW